MAKSTSLTKLSLFFILALFGCAEDDGITAQQSNIMFDDFNYESSTDPALQNFGWTVRTGYGGPGQTGCRWLEENIDFIDDEIISNNKLLRLSSTTNGKGSNTYQAEIYHTETYLEGTYAARIHFFDSPSEGIDGDEVNQTFFAISPLEYPLDSNYSELDFAEYLPNGGWGSGAPTFWMTSWETYQVSPYIQDSKTDEVDGSFEGWHTVSATVGNGEIKYYIDGKLRATHGGEYFPEQNMSITFNLWFIAGRLLNDTSKRTYQELVDWVYFSEDIELDHTQIETKVGELRQNDILRIDDFK